jgi:hypothetical protein
VVSVTPRPRFTAGKGPPVPIVQEVEWASEPVWTQRLEENSFACAGDRTSVVQSVLLRDNTVSIPEDLDTGLEYKPTLTYLAEAGTGYEPLGQSAVNPGSKSVSCVFIAHFFRTAH